MDSKLIHCPNCGVLAGSVPVSVEAQRVAALAAVRHVLSRICADPQVSCLLGHCTESYRLICEAMAADTGLTVEEVTDLYPPAPQPGRIALAQPTMGNLPLDATHAAVCASLSVSPLIAAEVIRSAKRRGDPLPYPHHDAGNDRPDCQFLSELDRAWNEYTANARARCRQVH